MQGHQEINARVFKRSFLLKKSLQHISIHAYMDLTFLDQGQFGSIEYAKQSQPLDLLQQERSFK